MNTLLQRLLTGWLMKNVLTGVTFRKAPRNSKGEIVLKRPKFIMGFALTFFGICLCLLFSAVFSHIFNGSERLQFIQLASVLTAFFGIFALLLVRSKTVVDDQGITTYRLNGMRHIDFNSITEIRFINQFGGCAVLSGGGITLRVPLGTVGFIECYDLLVEKLGTEKCALIEKQLQSCKRMLESYR
jgi:hypothetical protein